MGSFRVGESKVTLLLRARAKSGTHSSPPPKPPYSLPHYLEIVYQIGKYLQYNVK